MIHQCTKKYIGTRLLANSNWLTGGLPETLRRGFGGVGTFGALRFGRIAVNNGFKVFLLNNK